MRGLLCLVVVLSTQEAVGGLSFSSVHCHTAHCGRRRSSVVSTSSISAMNYAEDRLDRRARAMDRRPREEVNDSDAGGGDDGRRRKVTDSPSSTDDDLASDLHRAHEIFRLAASVTGEENRKGEGVSTSSVDGVLSQLREGHELAGRTLRDCGLCRQAAFHYAMAWMCDGDDERSAGTIHLFRAQSTS